jgi:dihydropteroate synthase
MLHKVKKNDLNYSLLVWKKAFNFIKNWAFENNIIRRADGVEYPETRSPNVGEQ